MRSKHLLAALLSLGLGQAAWAASSPTALVGPSVGSVDLLVSQGNKAYNDGKYADAREAYLKAVRAKPDNVPVYLNLARAYLQTKDIALACYTYKQYLKNAPPGTDVEKAKNEQEQCERQRKALSPAPADPGPGFVDQKAAFQEAAEGGKLLGPASASDVLKKMLKDGYAAPDLADLAAKLRTAAEKQANEGYNHALAREVVDPVQLRTTGQLFQLAEDVGATDERFAPRAHMLEGFADLQEKKFGEAEKEFKEAQGAGNDRDAKFYGAVAVYRSGDRKRAVRQLEADLPDDPRTALLKADMTIASDATQGASELSKLLYGSKFVNK